MVVVSATRVGHPSFDLPAAIDVIDSARIQDGQIRVNASEALAAVPGLVVQNRQNYAQDLQISSRGFGARSAFGVRGVRLISDGIPASMPDGQGQAATFNLDTAERIEVLRGPFSAIYGNHSGGVIQLFSKDGQNPPSVELNVTGGSYGTNKVDLNAQGEANGIGYVLDGSRFRTDGFRDHSAATREQAFGKITVKPTADSKLTIVANSLHQGNTQDPLGATWATFERDPRAGELDATRHAKSEAHPGRALQHAQEHRSSADRRHLGTALRRRPPARDGLWRQPRRDPVPGIYQRLPGAGHPFGRRGRLQARLLWHRHQLDPCQPAGRRQAQYHHRHRLRPLEG